MLMLNSENKLLLNGLPTSDLEEVKLKLLNSKSPLFITLDLLKVTLTNGVVKLILLTLLELTLCSNLPGNSVFPLLKLPHLQPEMLL